MAAPYYVSPEQLMRDKAEFAKKGVGRARAIVVVRADEGILLVAHNPSASLRKLSEVYDRIAFAGAGQYSEFESLRKAGVRHADLTGYAYSREDVTAKSLANGYSQMLGQIFAHEMKPMEVELLVAQVADATEDDEIYRISFDGSIAAEGDFAVVGGDSDRVVAFLARHFSGVGALGPSLALCKQALEEGGNGTLGAADLEVALIDRSVRGRAFRRLPTQQVESLLAG
jgi:proteasome alpha subunit